LLLPTLDIGKTANLSTASTILNSTVLVFIEQINLVQYLMAEY
jgi:hypothetical protein